MRVDNSLRGISWLRRKAVHIRQTNHILCGISFPTYVEHPGSDDFQLIPAQAILLLDDFTLLKLLKDAPEDDDLRIFNQDLAGFFISIEPEPLVGSWYMLLDLLRPYECEQ